MGLSFPASCRTLLMLVSDVAGGGTWQHRGMQHLSSIHTGTSDALSSKLAQGVSPLLHLLDNVPVRHGECGAVLPGDFCSGELSVLDLPFPMLALLCYILAAQVVPQASLWFDSCSICRATVASL